MGFQRLRERMVERQLAARGIRDPQVLDAMRRVPREAFVPPEWMDAAYADGPLEIGHGQTISQPFVVARTAEALQLRGGERVLDVGTGSGYAAAVYAEIGAEVYGIERIGALAREAAERLAALGYPGVRVRHGDGSSGWLEAAPFDAIASAAAAEQVPPAWRAQLAPGGRLVLPLGPQFAGQELLRLTRVDDGSTEGAWRTEFLDAVRFVPLVAGED